MVYALVAGGLGYAIKDSKPPVIKTVIEEIEVIRQATTTEPSQELKELSITLSECDKKLKNCWYTYSNNCNDECVVTECEVCPDFAQERAEYKKEIDSLLKSRDEARASEGELADKLNKCEAMLPFK